MASIYASNYGNTEIIVVDKGLERSVQRNIGIKRAKGDYFLFLDSDNYIHPFLIEECLRYMEWFPKVTGIYIPEVITTKGFFGKLRNWERWFYTGTGVDVARFVRNPCPLFDETMSGPEDSDWERRNSGSRTVSIYPIYHEDNISFIEYLKKKAYYTKSMKLYQRKYPNDRILKFPYRCFGIFLEKDKWKQFISNPLYAVCIMGLLFLRGVIYLWKR